MANAQSKPKKSTQRKIKDADYYQVAKERYRDDDLDFDDVPAVSTNDNGAWVQAWVWVSNEDVL